MTTLELFDALEAGIAALRSHDGNGVPRESSPISAGALLQAMQRSGVSADDVAAATGMDREEVNAWLRGLRPAPSWILAFIRLTAELPLPARRRLGRQASHPMRSRPDVRSHPFARIEEL